MAIADAILVIVDKRPLISARGIAVAIYGDRAYQQLVNGECLYLISSGKMERRVRADGIFGYQLLKKLRRA